MSRFVTLLHTTGITSSNILKSWAIAGIAGLMQLAPKSQKTILSFCTSMLRNECHHESHVCHALLEDLPWRLQQVTAHLVSGVDALPCPMHDNCRIPCMSHLAKACNAGIVCPWISESALYALSSLTKALTAVLSSRLNTFITTRLDHAVPAKERLTVR